MNSIICPRVLDAPPTDTLIVRRKYVS